MSATKEFPICSDIGHEFFFSRLPCPDEPCSQCGRYPVMERLDAEWSSDGPDAEEALWMELVLQHKLAPEQEELARELCAELGLPDCVVAAKAILLPAETHRPAAEGVAA